MYVFFKAVSETVKQIVMFKSDSNNGYKCFKYQIVDSGYYSKYLVK